MADLVERPCDIEGCDRIAFRQDAICRHCYKARCDEHIPFKVHGCYRDLENLCANLQNHRDTIYEEVFRIRPNQKCTLQIPENPSALLEGEERMLGSFNVNFVIAFEDGVKWILRVRQDRGHRPPRIIREADIRSEATTMNHLKANGISVPAAWLPPHFHSTDSSAAELPFDYFFTEFIEGEKWEVWRPLWKALNLPLKQTELFVDLYARHQIEMSKVPVPTRQLGCLTSNYDGQIVAGPVIARGTFMTHKPPYLLGPFKTIQERYLAHIQATLDYLALGAIGGFFLYDNEKRVTGILDWQWARITTKADAFASSDLFYFAHDFWVGEDKMTDEENMLIATYMRYGRPDLADCVRNGRLYQRLERIGRYDRTFEKAGFRIAFDRLPPDFDPPESDSRWRIYMLKRYKGHEGLQKLMGKLEWTIERAEAEAVVDEANMAERQRAREAKKKAEAEAAEEKEVAKDAKHGG
ncbi:hypothetical protein IAU59_004109 [Kwoniella sp. CBS 9459]